MAESKSSRQTSRERVVENLQSENRRNRDQPLAIEAEPSVDTLSGESGKSFGAIFINAQEEERKRVARELHDGVSQELALVSIQVAQAKMSAADEGLRSSLQKVYDKLQQVLSEVGHLSHELHPSTLKHLGLSAAIKVLCEDVSRVHGISVEFTHKGVPETASTDTALSLYRVAQEALQNVVKHSRCDHASVELRTSGNEITLRIRDRGIGFNPHRARTGLGLVSMRERLHLVGGRIVVSSRRGSGTCIEAHAPLACSKAEPAA